MTGAVKKGDRVAQVPSGRLGTVDEDAAEGATVKVDWDDRLGPYRCAPRTLVRAEDAKPWDESTAETFVSTAKKDAVKRLAASGKCVRCRGRGVIRLAGEEFACPDCHKED